MMTCIFCDPERQAIAENEFAIAIDDNFAVSLGHTLVVPKRHVATIFELTACEYEGCFNLVRVVRDMLSDRYRPDGFNLGVNCGQAAGQTVMHAHIHIIPRYDGDVEDPRGGVRGVIPGKQKY